MNELINYNNKISENENENENKEYIPEYLKDEYVTSYIVGNNHRECIMNLFKLHNESVNAWIMIFSNLSVLLLIIYIFMRYQFNITTSSIFILHLLAYTIHTPFSVGYHTFNTISKEEYIKWRKYDIYGIFLKNIILTFTLSFFTYNNFKYVLLNTSLTILISYYSLLKFKENEDDHKPLDKIEQGKLVGYTLLSYSIPFLYNLYNSILNKNYDLVFKISLINLITIILFGSAYCFRIPDIFYEPGKFNKIGTSHNLMHLGVIILSITEIMYIYLNAKKGNIIKSFK